MRPPSDPPAPERLLILPPATGDPTLEFFLLGLQRLWVDAIDRPDLEPWAALFDPPRALVPTARPTRTFIRGVLREQPCAFVLESTLMSTRAGITLRVWLFAVDGDDLRELAAHQGTAPTLDVLLPELARVPAFVLAHTRDVSPPPDAPGFAHMFGTSDPLAAIAVARAFGHAWLYGFDQDPGGAVAATDALGALATLDPSCTQLVRLGHAIFHHLYERTGDDPIAGRALVRRAVAGFDEPPVDWHGALDRFDARTEDGARALVDRVFCRDPVAGKVVLADFVGSWSVVHALARCDAEGGILVCVDIPALALHQGVAWWVTGPDGGLDGSLWVFETVADHLGFVAERNRPQQHRGCMLDWEATEHNRLIAPALATLSGLPFRRWCPIPTRAPPGNAWAQPRDVARLHAILQAFAAVLPAHRDALLDPDGPPQRWQVRTVAAGEVVDVTLTARAPELADD